MDDQQAHVFPPDGGYPNSPLPLVVYRRALPPDPAAMEDAFAENGWSGAWRDGIFTYHHFHSIAHEVLGIASGEVTVAFGGPNGKSLVLRAGDVVVIPAGVAHRNLGQSGDLVVVGAYPRGADYDIRHGNLAELEQVVRAISGVQLPGADPVMGQLEGLRKLWMNETEFD